MSFLSFGSGSRMAAVPAAGLGLALSLFQPISAVAQTPPSATAAPAAEPISPLLADVLRQLNKKARADQANTAGLFERYAQQHGTSAAAPPKALPTVLTGPAMGSSLPPALAQSLVPALVPTLGWAIEQLDPVSFAVLRPVPVGGAGPLLRTGDVFVLQFSTNLPGQVRLENVDPAGRVADLGQYTVLVDQLNRLPRDKGIELQGQPGVERLRFYFYPCLPPEAAGKRWAAEFQGRLPACDAGATRGLLPDTRRAGGASAPRQLVSLAQPDLNIAFAASTDFRPGETTMMEARIRHESRGHAR